MHNNCFFHYLNSKIDGFIQREELKDYDSEECKVIMNGWYMHHPEQWPPSDKIHPLFVAFHINSLAKELLHQIFRIENIEFGELFVIDRFKKNLPLGVFARFQRQNNK